MVKIVFYQNLQFNALLCFGIGQRQIPVLNCGRKALLLKNKENVWLHNKKETQIS